MVTFSTVPYPIHSHVHTGPRRAFRRKPALPRAELGPLRPQTTQKEPEPTKPAPVMQFSLPGTLRRGAVEKVTTDRSPVEVLSLRGDPTQTRAQIRAQGLKNSPRHPSSLTSPKSLYSHVAKPSARPPATPQIHCELPSPRVSSPRNLKI